MKKFLCCLPQKIKVKNLNMLFLVVKGSLLDLHEKSVFFAGFPGNSAAMSVDLAVYEAYIHVCVVKFRNYNEQLYGQELFSV